MFFAGELAQERRHPFFSVPTNGNCAEWHVVSDAGPYEIVPYLPGYLNILSSLDRFEKRKGVEPGAECRPVCPLVVWSVKNGAFRIDHLHNYCLG